MLLVHALLLAHPAVQLPPVRPAEFEPGIPGYYASSAAMDTSGSRSFIAYPAFDLNGNQQMLALASDGMGLEWTGPHRMDNGPLNTTKAFVQAHVGPSGNLYAAWLDLRLGNVEVVLTRSSDGGLTWSTDVFVPKEEAPGSEEVSNFDFEVLPGSPDTLVFLLSTWSGGIRELTLAVSPDGGASFQPVRTVSALGLGAADANAGYLAVDPLLGTIHVAWTDDRSGLDQVYYQRSDDLGASWLPADRQLDGGLTGTDRTLSITPLDLDPASGVLAVTFHRRMGLLGPDVPHAAVSPDRGLSWQPAQAWTSAPPGIDANTPVVAAFDGSVAVGYVDDRSGTPECYLTHSSDLGATTTELQMSSGGAWYPFFDESDEGDDLILGWGDDTYELMVAHARDGSFQFGTPLKLSDTDWPGTRAAAYNGAYDNVVATWSGTHSSGDRRLRVGGGFRPQFVEPVGDLRAGNSVSFAVHGFRESAAGSPFHVAIAQAAGHLPLPDGRDVGLQNDAWLGATRALSALGGVLQPGGGGTTGNVTLPTSIPVGTTLAIAALGPLDRGVSTIQITDVRLLPTVP